MNDTTEVAIVTAMEREVEPLIRDWTMILGHSRRVYEKGKVVLVASGIGEHSAGKAARGVLQFRQPKVILSVGLAGALDPAVTVGAVIIPTKVLRQTTGQEFTIEGGEGTLLTAAGVASVAQKHQLAAAFGAQIVDMEAAAVAEVAGKNRLKFAAIKAVSDELAFPMPPMDRFVDEEGRFKTGHFVAHFALRPHTWPLVSRLRGNAEKATRALCSVLSKIHDAEDVWALLQPGAMRVS
jgi:adenosylhomocysteine nucleosidase